MRHRQLIGAHVTAGSSYYLTDNLGSIVGMVDGNQHTQATYSYDPAGNTRSTSGPYPLLSNNPIRYAGGYQTTTGLTKFGARYYDPNTARFTQPDPSGQESNPYTYAGNNPINASDPDGLLFGISCGICKTIAAGIAGAIAGGAVFSIVSGLGFPEIAPAVAGCAGAAVGSEVLGKGSASELFSACLAGAVSGAVGAIVKPYVLRYFYDNGH